MTTTAAIAAARARVGGATPLWLVTLPHPLVAAPGFGPTRRFVRDTVNLVSRGQTFTAWPIEIARGPQSERRPSVRLTLAAGPDASLIQALQTAQDLTALLELVWSSAPDQPVHVTAPLRVTSVGLPAETSNAITLAAALAGRGGDQAAMNRSFTPRLNPGLFNSAA